MGDHRKTGKARPAKLPTSRPTIGLLIGRLGDQRYQAYVWPGVADVARERDVNLVCFVGGALRSPYEFDTQRNVVYDLAGPENVDGLVAMSGSLGQFIGLDQLRRFYHERYRSLPLVNIALAMEGIPSVVVDNESGEREAITHLIEVHGYRRIAFIRGPETNPDAEQRYLAYTKVLAEHGLPLDPDLVAPGNFLSPSGEAAIHLLLDQRKVDFEAVASANDEMALGVLAALRARGRRVPGDVSVVGFDNIQEARFAAPPLTTIYQPLYEQGRRATEMLLALLAGEDVPEQITLPTELVVRRSCGCLSRAESQIAMTPEPWTSDLVEAPFSARRERILFEMVEAVGVSVADLDPGWAERLLEAFSATLKDPPRGPFLPTLDEILRQVGAKGGDVALWHRVLSVLRNHALPYLAGGENPSRADSLWQQARVLVEESALWAQAYRRIQTERQALDFNIGISEPLMTAFDLAGLTDVIAHQLPQMGIGSCYLSLYEQPPSGEQAAPAEWSRLILAYNQQGRLQLEPGGRRFPSRQLVPEGILPHGQRCAIMLEPLHFRDETQLGFVLFEPLETEVGELREALSRQISTALKGALLLQERKQAEKALLESEEKYRQLVESSMLGISISRGYRIIFANPALLNIFGYDDLEDFVRKPLLEYIAPASREWITAMIRAIDQGKIQPNEFEYDVLRKDGKIRTLHASTTHMTIGGEIYTQTTFQDITERKQAEEALLESEENYRRLFEAESDAIFLIDNQTGNILQANGAAATLYGYSVEELLTMRNSDLSAEPEQTQKVTRETPVSGRVIDIPLRWHRKKDGTVFPVEITGRFFVHQGRPTHIAAVRDITERRRVEEALQKSEQLFRAIIEHSHDAVTMLAADGTVLYDSPSVVRVLGYSATERIGRKIFEFIHPDDRQNVALGFAQSVQQPGAVMSYQARFLHKDGTLHWIEGVRTNLLHEPMVQAVVSNFRDITERKRDEEKIRAALEEKETLLREVHHRVKNNLQAMIYLIGMRSAQVRNKGTQQFLKELEEQARTMSLVYEQLYQSESLARVAMATYIQQLVANVLEAFGEGRNIRLKLDVAPVFLDVTQAMPCGLIVNELVTNILKHAFPSGFKKRPLVSISLKTEGKRYMLAVNDNGVGLPAGHDWRTSQTLGLRLVNLWATHQLGGTLDVKTDPGTTYIVTFGG